MLAAVTGNTEDPAAADAGAPADAHAGQTALMVVARTGSVEAAKLLRKARRSRPRTWAGRPLMWAARRASLR
jgi:hypothetical protein